MKAVLVSAAAFAALTVAASAGAKQPPIFAQAQAVGTIGSAFTVDVKPGAMVLDTITIQPGGSFGWHTHGSPFAVVVKKGTLTVLDPSVHSCVPFTVSKGEAFVEPAHHVHLARNDTATPVTVYAMYLGIPKGKESNIPEQAPAGSNA